MGKKTKEELYHDAINILDLIEISVPDQKQFSFIRKRVLDLANEVLKLGDPDGKY